MFFGNSRPAETGQEKREEPRVSDPRESMPTGGVEKPTRPGKQKTRRVLLVDPSPTLRPALERCTAQHGRVTVVYAASIADARQLIESGGRIDLAVVQPALSDGSGLDLARDLKQRDTATAAVVLTADADFALAQQAMRLGATDVILKPGVDGDEQAWIDSAVQRVGEALDRQWIERERSARIRRLKKLCRRLDAARQEVSEQVDILCNDLVTAYQELAVQVQNINNTAGYQDAVGEELDLEAVLRKTLEYLVEQAGPCNAAVFLPSSADEYALGGYVNYDCTKESADMLLEHLADVLAPRVGESDEPVLHATSNKALCDLLGDDWNYLADCHLLALPAMHDGEALAVITLFRDDSQPFTEMAIESLASVADQMGELLGRIIRVHHRAMPDFDPPAPHDTFLPPSEWDGYHEQADPFEGEDEDELPF